MSAPLDHYRGTLPGRPKPFDRTGVEIRLANGKRKRVNTREYRDWKTSAADVLAGLGRWRSFPPDTELAVTLVVRRDGVDVSIEPVDPCRPAGITGDLDNYAKAILDALQLAKTFANDRQVSRLAVTFDNGRSGQ